MLFLCTHNAGRSQMAMGFFQRYAGDAAIAWSGGSEPGDEVNPAAIAAMAERGIDISGEYPKPWTDEVVRAADVVITMGCGDACPVFPGKRYEEWVLTTRPASTSPPYDRSATRSNGDVLTLLDNSVSPHNTDPARTDTRQAAAFHPHERRPTETAVGAVNTRDCHGDRRQVRPMDQQDEPQQRASSNERLADLLETLAALRLSPGDGRGRVPHSPQRRIPNEAGIPSQGRRTSKPRVCGAVSMPIR